MKFIKLTETLAGGGNVVVVINAAAISSLKVSDRGVDTHMFMTNGKYYFIKEGIDEILEKIYE